ncbi:MAG: M14 family metallocarboxypeptidase [Verrucomicrobiales bacterium]|nr:M14 family metallocarboxypeptidase [Verrucomicrobiales bacterium]
MSAIVRGDRLRSGHDFHFLVEEWDRLCEDRGWKKTVIAEVDELPVFAVENGIASEGGKDGIYVSAGVHGDECAPPWALLEWAESLTEADEGRPMLLFPCLNPVGIVDNTRMDQDGVDLNRNFQNPDIPVIGAWQEFLEGRSFQMAVNLHEDYDATGIYLYELARSEPIGDKLLSACEDLIRRETSDLVDGSDFQNGLMQREVDDESLREVVERDLEGGWPEAIWLYLHYSKDSFTFETPSEMALDKRVATHRRFLEVVSKRCTHCPE